MGLRTVVVFTVGAGRSGKSYRRCAHFLVREFLPNDQGRHVSNFPIQFDPWTDDAGVPRAGLVAIAKEMSNIEEAVVRERVLVIPPDEVAKWRNDGYTGKTGQPLHGPWETFKDFDLRGCHLAIDEIHNFCGTKSHGNIRAEWQKWLGELGHRGATIEFLTQAEGKVAKEISMEAEIRYDLVAQESRRDPILRIQNYYWYNLWAKLTGRWKPSCWIHEARQVKKKFVDEGNAERFWFDPKLFGVYNTWSAPQAGGQGGGPGKKEYERMTWPQLLLWFLFANAVQLSTPIVLTVAVLLGWFNRSWIVDSYFASFSLPGVAAPGSATPGAKPPAAAVVAGQGGALAVPVKLPTFEGRPLTPEKVFDVVARLELLEDQAVLHEETMTHQSERLAEMEKRLLEAFAVSGVSRDRVYFMDGGSYAIGERIDFGPYEGLKVESIDYGKRVVLLEGGKSLRMGIGDSGGGVASAPAWLQSLAAGKASAKPSPAPFSGGLPRVSSDTKPAQRSIVAKPARDDLDGSHAARQVRAPDGRSAPSFHRARTVTRPAAGDSRTE